MKVFPWEQALAALKSALSPNLLHFDEKRRYTASLDNLRISQMPSVVICPQEEADIGKVLELANEFEIPVVVRGAGSATTGSAMPEVNGWVIDLSSWKELHIDPQSKMAYVQPGVTVEAIDQAAAEFDLTYPPDPGSKKYATIGGTLATNAGGLRGAKYGVTRDYVLSLEGFLPTGAFVRWGANLRKCATGYNMRDLWVGSEGTLGIITGAVLRLLPKPKSKVTLLGLFGSDEAALSTVEAILSTGLTPSVLEFLDTQSLQCTYQFWKKKDFSRLKKLPSEFLQRWKGEKKAAALLIEADGWPDEVEACFESFSGILEQDSLVHASSTDPIIIENLWTLRRSCSQAMFEWGDVKLNEDVVVPLTAQKALLELTSKINRETGLATPTFGHAADGNFHVHIMFHANQPEEKDKAQDALRVLMQAVLDMGGVISGEHGIGLAKTPFFPDQHSEAEFLAMRKIKESLDPKNILNPSTFWSHFEIWDHPRESVHLPWDH